jgi:1-phosphatidylinositol-3-phosphate 5-kinase
VKESAFLGGVGKGEPTIVTPKQYKQRFCSAMERYFPLVCPCSHIMPIYLHAEICFQVPDRWMKQKDTPEEDSSHSLVDLWPDW